MEKIIELANQHLDEKKYSEAVKVLVNAGIIKGSSLDAILERMISRLGIADGYRQIRMPLPANGSVPTAYDKCIAILAARPNVTLDEVAEFAGCSRSFAVEAKRKFKHEQRKHKETNISESSS